MTLVLLVAVLCGETMPRLRKFESVENLYLVPPSSFQVSRLRMSLASEGVLNMLDSTSQLGYRLSRRVILATLQDLSI